ncbi:MAG: sulfatase [Myxococcota bacterium]
MPRRARILLLGVALAVPVGCGPSAGSPATPRNVVLISIDTLRADHLGAYGHERATSPNLDGFAGRGVLFENVSSTAPWTLPAHASMLTGLLPANHGVRTHVHRLPDDVPALAQTLSDRGFDTAAFVNAYFMEERFGLDRGFDLYRSFPEDQSRSGATLRVLEAAERWLAARGDAPFLLLVHLFDVHSSYRSLPAYEALFTEGEHRYTGDTFEIMLGMNGDVPLGADDADRLARLYDASIRQLDDQLKSFLDALAYHGPDADTLVVVTSDHGEEFLEHGSMVHGHTHYEEVLRVPLLMAGPGLPAGRRVSAPASLVDLVPTLLDLLGVDDAPPGDGRSLRGSWEQRGGGPPRVLLAEGGPMEENALMSVRHGDLKLIVDRRNGERRLFDLARDPGEKDDLASRRPEDVAALASRLAGYVRTAREPVVLEAPGEEAEERLRALGYLAP